MKNKNTILKYNLSYCHIWYTVISNLKQYLNVIKLSKIKMEAIVFKERINAYVQVWLGFYYLCDLGKPKQTNK